MKRDKILDKLYLFVHAVGLATAFLIVPGDTLSAFSGSDIIFEPIDHANQLTSLSITDIVQDRHGFIWIATREGLNKYDGRSVTTIQHIPYRSNTLPHNAINCLLIDKDETTLWIGSDKGLINYDMLTAHYTIYQQDEDANTQPTESFGSNTITAISQMEDGTLWVGTRKGLSKILNSTRAIETFYSSNSSHSLPSNSILSLFYDKNGELWIGTSKGLCRYDSSSNQFIQYNKHTLLQQELPSQVIMDIEQTEDGNLQLACFKGGLVSLNSKENTFQVVSLSNNLVTTILADSPYTIWVASRGEGLFKVDTLTGSMTNYRHDASNQNSLCHDNPTALFKDSSALIWVGSDGAGISKLDKNKRNHRILYHDPHNKDSIAFGKVSALHEDTFGNLWIAVDGSGLFRYTSSDHRVYAYNLKSNSTDFSAVDYISALYEDSLGRIWLGSERGLFLYNKNSDDFTHVTSPPLDSKDKSRNKITSIAEDFQKVLWVGTEGNGLFSYNRETDEYSHYTHLSTNTESISSNNIHALLCDWQGVIWIATEGGLNKLLPSTKSFIHYQYDEKKITTISSNSVSTLLEDEEKRLWLGTYGGGLNLFDKETETFTHILREDGLASNTIHSLQEDAQGRIWCATSNGISIYNKATKQLSLIDQNEGVVNAEFNRGSAKGRNGALYFGAIHGIYKFNYKDVSKDDFQPKVHITKVTLNNTQTKRKQAIYMEDEIVLPYDKTYISFEFASLDYSSPLHNRYQYLMEGVDKLWVQSGSRNFASYTNLQPGSYTFRVKGTNSKGTWSPKTASITVKVTRPPWKSWWAYLLYVVGSAGLIYLLLELKVRFALEGKLDELSVTQKKLEIANKKLKGLIVRDSLTGLFNRRYLDTTLTKIWNHSLRTKSPISMLIIDIDFFKPYNDNYGHQAGDVALTSVAQNLESHISRENDFVCRYGGEEFCIVLPDTGREGATKLSVRCIEGVRALNITHKLSNAAAHLTISVGAATIIPRPDSKEKDFFKLVDDALYLAKKQGRNRYYFNNVT